MANNHTPFTKVPVNKIEEQVNNKNKAPLADLSHGSKGMNDGSKFDSIPSSSFVVPALPMAPETMLAENDESLRFNCKYCERKFANKQALGGHQNAHRVSRFIEKNKKSAMMEMGYPTNDLLWSPGCPFVHLHALNGAMVNGPYYVPLTEKDLLGYPPGSGVLEPCHHNVAIEQRPRPMTNSPFASPIIIGDQIANGSYFSTEENASFNGERIPTAAVNPLSNVVPKLLFNNTTETGGNVESNAAETGDNVESNELEKLQIPDSELDLTLKLGY